MDKPRIRARGQVWMGNEDGLCASGYQLAGTGWRGPLDVPPGNQSHGSCDFAAKSLPPPQKFAQQILMDSQDAGDLMQDLPPAAAAPRQPPPAPPMPPLEKTWGDHEDDELFSNDGVCSPENDDLGEGADEDPNEFLGAARGS